MTLTPREKRSIEALVATVKSVAAMVPGVGQGIAALDAYQRAERDRCFQEAIDYLRTKVADLAGFLENDWFRTENGQEFFRKVFASVLDSQLEEKRQLFINALIHGAEGESEDFSQLEKLKFVDMLRRLSKAALMVLADMHPKFEKTVWRRGQAVDPNATSPTINAVILASELRDKYKDPYLVMAAISEMESEGVFSRTGASGEQLMEAPTVAGFSTELYYTDFSAKFVEFISIRPQE